MCKCKDGPSTNVKLIFCPPPRNFVNVVEGGYWITLRQAVCLSVHASGSNNYYGFTTLRPFPCTWTPTQIRLFLCSNLKYASHYLCQQCHEPSTWFRINNDSNMFIISNNKSKNMFT